MADHASKVRRTRARRFLKSAKLRQFYQPLKEFGAESCADYFDSSIDDNELYEMGMNSDEVGRFRKALFEYTPHDIDEFLCKANLAHHIPVFVTQMGMKELEDLLEFDHDTLVSIMGEEDAERVHSASSQLTSSVHQVRKLSVGLAMNKDHLEEGLDTSEEESEPPAFNNHYPNPSPVSNPLSPGPSPMSFRSSPSTDIMQTMNRPPPTQVTPPTRRPMPTAQSFSASSQLPSSTPPASRPLRNSQSAGPGRQGPPLTTPPKKPGVMGRSISMNNLGRSGGIRSFRKTMAKATGMRGAMSGKKVDDDGADDSGSLSNSAAMNLSSPLAAEVSKTNEEVVMDVVIKGNRLGVALTNARDDGCLFVDMLQPGGAAEVAGLKAGDIVKAINDDASFAYMPVGTVVKRLAPVDGKPRVMTKFTVLRNAKNKVITSAELKKAEADQLNRYKQIALQKEKQQKLAEEEEAQRLEKLQLAEEQRNAANNFYKGLREKEQNPQPSLAPQTSDQWKLQFEQMQQQQAQQQLQHQQEQQRQMQLQQQQEQQLRQQQQQEQQLRQQQQQEQQLRQQEHEQQLRQQEHEQQLRQQQQMSIEQARWKAQFERLAQHQQDQQPKQQPNQESQRAVVQSQMPPPAALRSSNDRQQPNISPVATHTQSPQQYEQQFQQSAQQPSRAQAKQSASLPIVGRDVRLFMKIIGLEAFESKIVDLGFESMSDLLNMKLVEDVDFSEIGMDEYEIAKLKHEIGLKLLVQKAMSPEPSQPPSLDVRQVRNFLDSAQLGAFAGKIESHGIQSLSDLMNANKLSDFDLSVSIGMTPSQIEQFRRHTAARSRPINKRYQVTAQVVNVEDV